VRDLSQQYRKVRRFTEELVRPLSPEDCTIQSMPDASPIRWHLAHTTWFFETFVLAHSTRFREFDESFRFLFNSYYNTVGEQFSRPQRGLLSRPNQQQVEAYRQHVDEAMLELLSNNASDDLKNVIEVGLHHEQQHQELILTDIKHALSCNPLLPVYRDGCIGGKTETVSPGWLPFDEGVRAIGHEGGDFAYDNESPRHRVFLDAFEICDRLVSCGQYIQFIDDGGYQRPELWLSLGWNQRQAGDWTSPLYWTDDDGRWSQFTLAGLQPVGLDQPLTHISCLCPLVRLPFADRGGMGTCCEPPGRRRALRRYVTFDRSSDSSDLRSRTGARASPDVW